MAALPGHKKEGGRAKGTPNKKTKELMELIGDFSPVPGLIAICERDYKALGIEEFIFVEKAEGEVKAQPTITVDLQMQAMKELMKYMYPQKRAVELSNPEGQVFKVIIEDYSKK